MLHFLTLSPIFFNGPLVQCHEWAVFSNFPFVFSITFLFLVTFSKRKLDYSLIPMEVFNILLYQVWCCFLFIGLIIWPEFNIVGVDNKIIKSSIFSSEWRIVFNELIGWLLWPGVSMMVLDAITNLALLVNWKKYFKSLPCFRPSWYGICFFPDLSTISTLIRKYATLETFNDSAITLVSCQGLLKWSEKKILF